MYWLSTHFWRDAVPWAIIGAVIPSFLFYAWRLSRSYAQVIETQGPTPLSKKETSGLNSLIQVDNARYRDAASETHNPGIFFVIRRRRGIA